MWEQESAACLELGPQSLPDESPSSLPGHAIWEGWREVCRQAKKEAEGSRGHALFSIALEIARRGKERGSHGSKWFGVQLSKAPRLCSQTWPPGNAHTWKYLEFLWLARCLGYNLKVAGTSYSQIYTDSKLLNQWKSPPENQGPVKKIEMAFPSFYLISESNASR